MAKLFSLVIIFVTSKEILPGLLARDNALLD